MADLEDVLVGWATQAGSVDDKAHQLESEGTGPQDQEIHRSLCGQVSGPAWTPAEPGVERCQECQASSAASPD